MGSLHKNFQLMLEFLKAPFLVLEFFLLYINDLPNGFICNIAIHGDNTTLYSKCDQAPDLWLQLELASELESNFNLISMLEKLIWFHLTSLRTLLVL